MRRRAERRARDEGHEREDSNGPEAMAGEAVATSVPKRGWLQGTRRGAKGETSGVGNHTYALCCHLPTLAARSSYIKPVLRLSTPDVP